MPKNYLLDGLYSSVRQWTHTFHIICVGNELHFPCRVGPTLLCWTGHLRTLPSKQTLGIPAVTKRLCYLPSIRCLLYLPSLRSHRCPLPSVCIQASEINDYCRNVARLDLVSGRGLLEFNLYGTSVYRDIQRNNNNIVI